MLHDVLIGVLLIIISKGTIIIFLYAVVNNTYRSHLATTIDILLHLATNNVDIGVTTHAASPLHRRIGVMCRSATPVNFNSGWVTIVFTAVTTAIDTSVNCTISDGDGSILTHRTQLAATINIALNKGVFATDVDGRGFRLSHLCPDRVNRCIIKKSQTSHRATEYVTAMLGTLWQVTRFIFDKISTNRTTADIDDYMAIGLRILTSRIIFLKLTIVIIIRISELSSNRCQTSTTIDTAEYSTILYIHLDISTHSTGRLGITAETTATAEHVTVHVGSTGSTNDNIRVTGCNSSSASTNGNRTTNVGLCITYDVTILSSTER